MSQIAPAMLYLVFALGLLLFGFLFRLEDGAEMFQSAVVPILDTPWSVSPYKTIYDVNSPSEVYEWLTKTFVNQLYMEYPRPGDEQGFCTEVFKCLLNEGDTDDKAQCADGLDRGNDNCPSYMGTLDVDCCQPCIGSDCQNFTAPTVAAPTISRAVTDLSANCANDMPSWLQDLDQWNRADTARANAQSQPSSSEDVVFCPERISKVDANLDTRTKVGGRMLMVGQYNRILMARFTMKRVKLVPHTSKAFNNAYSDRVNSDYTNAYAYTPSAENEEPFGRNRMYHYEKDKGFKHAGGFVSYITFDKPKDEILTQIANLKYNYWFDLNQGSFAVEMLLFNGNVDRFLYVSFVFQHDFSGSTLVSANVHQLDLSLHDFANPVTYVRFGCYIIILLLFCVFVKTEIDDMTADYATYFSNFMLLVHCISLVLCAICIVQYFMIVFSYAYINFEFPLPVPKAERYRDFEDLVNLANSMGDFMLIISLNLCLVLCRLITLMTTIVPQSGVIFNTFGSMKYNLVAFFMMFVIMVLGFTMAGYFLFGTRAESYSTMTQAFLSTLRLMQREGAREQLNNADPMMANIYFVVFHLFFLIVLQILISVLIYGYDKEKERQHTQDSDTADKYPLKKIWRATTAYLRRYTNWLFRWLVSLQTFLFDVQGGPTARPNWEQVARLRDRRPTKPRIRNVDYGRVRDRDGDGGDDVDISTDVTLRAVYPWYPDGMMHYYVDEVKPEGPAQEFKVAKNTFRLVAIQRQGDEPDRKHFRSLESFKKTYRGDPQKLLKEAQDSRASTSVTLEFEGGVQPLSKECGLLLFFIAVFVAFSLQVCRVEDSYLMSVVQERALVEPEWYQYNPTRIMNLNKMDTIQTIEKWARSSILDKEYACVTSLTGSEECAQSTLTDETRSDWFLWAAGYPFAYTPAVDNASLLHIPKTTPLAQAQGRTSVSVSQTVQMKEYNVGVMTNNHVRLSVQQSCFRQNPNERWRGGYPYQLDPVFKGASCADQNCVKQMLEKSDTCLTASGEQRNVGSMKGSWSSIKYSYAEEGTYNSVGGYAIGLGATKDEAAWILKIISEDRFFQADSASFVFEFVTYNANFDLFAYTLVKFSLKGTGKLVHEVATSVFPLNVFSQGSQENSSTYVLLSDIFFALYIVAALIFTAYFCWDLSIQYFITVNLSRKWYMFIFDFFLEDWWNFVDLASLILNIAVIEHVFKYMLIGGSIWVSRQGIRSWTLDYKFSTVATSDTVDPFAKFNQVADVYSWFTGLAAVNGLFLMLRLLKYLNGLTALRLVMTAISSAINELAVMTIIFFLMLLSFMCMFTFRYGIQYERFSTLNESFINLFLFLNGRFQVADLIEVSPIYFAVVFTFFEVMFILIVNMFLAAIVYRWKDTRRDAQEVTLLGAWQKLKEPFSLSVLSFDKGEKQELTLVKLDGDFWQKLAVLRHISFLDESGRITLKGEDTHRRREPGEAGAAARQREEGDASDSEASSEPDGAGGGGFNFEKEEDQKKFLKVFKKAHMEIASQMCRSIVVPRHDDGAGVGVLEDAAPVDEEEEQEPEFEDDFSQVEMVGIVEDSQPQERSLDITKRMNEKLEESEHPAEEIWLDALVTILEEAGALERLQRFFRPLPMIKPTKPQELLSFKQKKAKMEFRLNMFLRWLQEEARIKHYRFLKEMAQDKEKNLKQQSLVLTDYLETLDEQIVNLEKEIKVLERKNAHMRSHVSPLL